MAERRAERRWSFPRWLCAPAAVAAVVLLVGLTWAARSAGAPAVPSGPGTGVAGTSWRAASPGG